MKRSKTLVALAFASVSASTGAGACSMVEGYKVPTNLELAEAADTIVIATVESQRKAAADADPWAGAVITKPVKLLKGAQLPATVEIPGSIIADEPRLARMVIASAPRELRRANPGAMIGGCVRYIFDRGMKLVLFLKRDASGNLIPFRSSFSRDAEDVADENALWVKAVREYAAISLLPKRERKPAMKARIVALKADASDDANVLLARDMEVELSGKRLPPYD